jgi:hypothetical protein
LGADDAALDTVGYCPHGSDPEEPFVEVVWRVNQELLHHGAEVALIRYRVRGERQSRTGVPCSNESRNRLRGRPPP